MRWWPNNHLNQNTFCEKRPNLKLHNKEQIVDNINLARNDWANIKDNIKSVIKKYEPRVAITSIKVDNMESDNSYHIAVNFNIKEYDSASGVEIVLRRLR